MEEWGTTAVELANTSELLNLTLPNIKKQRNCLSQVIVVTCIYDFAICILFMLIWYSTFMNKLFRFCQKFIT